MQKTIKQNNISVFAFRAFFALAVFALIFSVLTGVALARTVDTGSSATNFSTKSNTSLCSSILSGSYQYKVVFPDITLVGHKDPKQSTAGANIPAGDYKVTILTLDSYDDRKTMSQSNEQLFLSFGGTETGLTTDLPDNAVTGYSIDVFDNIDLASAITSVMAKHVIFKGITGANSVRPVCAVFEPINQNPELNISCSASPTAVGVNQNVNWNSTVSGGNGSYTYSWSGTDGLSTTTRNTSKSYSSNGTKNATITVRSGDQVESANCSVNVSTQTTGLSLSCEVDDSSVDIDEDVRYTANVTGGNGNYIYSWSGTDGLFSTNRSFDWSYDDSGTKRANITVFSNGETVSDSCTVKVNDDEDTNLSVSCSADDSSVQVGDRVRWTAEVDGDDGDVDYDWSGDDGLDSSNSSPSMYYDTPGTKEATVRVRSNGDTDTDTCTVRVTGNSVLSYSQYNPNNQVLDAVYLNEVPYTGLADNKTLLWFIIGLVLLSAYLAYVFLAYKKNFGPNSHKVHNK